MSADEDIGNELMKVGCALIVAALIVGGALTFTVVQIIHMFHHSH